MLRSPGTIGLTVYAHRLWRVTECGCRERERRIYARGLCQSCYSMRLEDGTIGSYGYVRADRIKEYAGLRSAGYSISEAGQRLGVVYRTAQRYETALKDAGMAPWREWTAMERSHAA